MDLFSKVCFRAFTGLSIFTKAAGPSPIALSVFLLLASSNVSAQQKRFPPAGIPVPQSIRSDLQNKLQQLQREIAETYESRKGDNVLQLFPDVQIYEKAVRYALEHNEFYRTNEFAIADQLIQEGIRRAQQFKTGTYAWRQSKGPSVFAYKSRIDGSVQPYGLVIPESYDPKSGRKYRLDVWLHGRDEKLTELKFIHERSTKVGEFAPEDTFVLHPYGRYCNAFKFAGEVDVFEAIKAVREQFAIDPSRIALRGFSMGGAGVWHLATHYADEWVCAAPGAGFAETSRYLRVKPGSVPEYERALWHWYDATDYALNLYQCPTIAYSGELDKQRQAADVMEEALRAEGLPLVHLIGAKTEHRYQPETKRLLNTLVDSLAAKGKSAEPEEIRFTTHTLRYPKMHWLILLGLEKHWVRADVRGRLLADRIEISCTNVTSFAVHLRRETAARMRELKINGASVALGQMPASPDYLVLSKTNGTWGASGSLFATMTKGPGHQGPIDDAFMDSFVIVGRSTNGFHNPTDSWIDGEFKRALHEWRAQFRGDPPVLSADEAINYIQNSNLVLWGDPQSNELIRKILPKLPLQWTAQKITFGGKSYDARAHVPLLIFPNPLNPERYVVLNSGFTFRGFGSNADQTAKLPDYAVLDITQDNPFSAGIAAAGFFNEQWQLP